MKIILLFSLYILILSNRELHGNPTSQMVSPIKNRDSLVLVDRAFLLLSHKSDSLEKLISAIDILKEEEKTRYRTVIRMILDRKENPIDLRSFYSMTADYGRLTNGIKGRTFISQPIVYHVLIQGLSLPNRTIRNAILKKLLEYSCPDKIVPYKKEILLAIKADYSYSDFNMNDFIELVALLPLTSEEKETKFKINESTPMKIKARFGDSISEATLVSKFEKMTTLDNSIVLSSELGYIGTELCAKALAKNIFAPLLSEKMEDVVGQISIQFYIIRALSHIFPDEPLFTSEFERIVFVKEEYSQDEKEISRTKSAYEGMTMHNERRNNEISNYYLDISKWVHNKYGFYPKDPLPKPILAR